MENTKTRKFSPREFLQQNSYIFSAVLVIVAFYLINHSFLTLYSLQNMSLEIAPLLPMACGIGFVLYTGCIDLSIGAVASAACVITGTYVPQTGHWMIPLMLIFGAAVGLINGTLVSRMKIPSFIVTLCAQSVYRAMAIIAIGANERAARLAGVNTARIKTLAFVLCSVGAAIGGVMYAYKLKSSVPTIGDNLYMMAISSVALGGTLFSGGRGSALRTLIGVVTVISISSGMNMAGVDPLWKEVVFGVVLIVAVAINSEKGGRDLIIK